MGLDVSDLAGISEPAKKLIEVISNGIGAAYRPTSIRREAKARAFEVREIAQAQADAKRIEAAADTQVAIARIQELADNNPELVQRAKNRLLLREVEGQLNVEAIAEHALNQLPDHVSEQPVDASWRRKFFLEAENVCDQDLQLLWGKVLAGEVATPGSFSVRTLNVLRQLSQFEALLFQQLCSIAFSSGWVLLTQHDISAAISPYGLGYDNLMHLREAGLLMEGDTLTRAVFPEIPGTAEEIWSTHYVNNGVTIKVTRSTPAPVKARALALTNAGAQLQQLIPPNPNAAYLAAAAKALRELGLSVKKGVLTEVEPGTSVLTFDEDL